MGASPTVTTTRHDSASEKRLATERPAGRGRLVPITVKERLRVCEHGRGKHARAADHNGSASFSRTGPTWPPDEPRALSWGHSGACGTPHRRAEGSYGQ